MTPTLRTDARRLIELVQAYLTAEYRWTEDGDWHDLRIGLPAPGLEMRFLECRSFGMMSAWNPWSELRSDFDNRAADQILQGLLAERGVPHCAAFASSPNRSWREPSWIVMDMDEADFIFLQRANEQLGTLWWTRGSPVRLRLDATRPAGMADDAHVDWLR